MKIIINSCYGGYHLSDKAFEEYLNRKEVKFHKWDDGYFTVFSTVTKEEYEAAGAKGFHNMTDQEKKEYNALYLSYRDVPRNDPILVDIVEKLGDEASGKYSKLKIVDIPDDVKWTIEEYDGNEWVAEVHRIWN